MSIEALIQAIGGAVVFVGTGHVSIRAWSVLFEELRTFRRLGRSLVLVVATLSLTLISVGALAKLFLAGNGDAGIVDAVLFCGLGLWNVLIVGRWITGMGHDALNEWSERDAEACDAVARRCHHPHQPHWGP